MTSASSVHSTLDVRALAGTRETVAYRDGGLWPVLNLTHDGVIVAAARAGAGHVGPGGRLDVIRSHDGGRNWGPPNVVADHLDWSEANPGVGVAQDGTVVLAYMRSGMFDAEGNYAPERRNEQGHRRAEVWYTRSPDGGLTWEPPQPLELIPFYFGAPFGKIVTLPDGTLLMPLYCEPDTASRPGFSSSYVLRSRDDGRTWGEPSLIQENCGEPAVTLLPNGELIAALRGSDPDEALWISRSSDGGASWSSMEQVTGARQHPGDMVILRDGSILLTYGNRNPPYRIEGRISRDGGRTWLDPLLCFSGNLYGADLPGPRPTDLGYPSSVVRRTNGAGEGVCVYYYNPTRNTSESRPRQGNERLYLVDHYCAIAVTWDEEELLAAVRAIAGE